MRQLEEAYSALFQLIIEHAYREGDFTLASGQKSRFYIDLKQIMFRPDAQLYLGKLLWAQAEELEQVVLDGIAGVGGMALGAVPLVTTLSNTAFASNKNWPGVIARKTTKEHGTGATLEGRSSVPSKSCLILVEDTVTTGGSTIQAAQAYRAAGYSVSNVLAVVDRQAGGQEKMQQVALQLRSLYLLETLQGGQEACAKRFQQLWPQVP